MKRRTRAFTLVELLVVIGIISVLIATLLPALSGARSAANLVDCQARLHSMGQALQIYTINSRGLLPWGYVDRTDFASWTDPATRYTQTPGNKEPYWWWYFTLSEAMGQYPIDTQAGSPTYGLATRLSAIFRDKDTIDGNDFRYVCHYTVNPRLFYLSNYADIWSIPVIPPQDRLLRKMSQVRKTSSVFAIWDGPQCADSATNYNAYATANSLDRFGVDAAASGLCYGGDPRRINYDLAVYPGTLGGSYLLSGKATQAQYNIDLPTFLSWSSHLRFRHMRNTTLAALCLDGHVETRKVGTVLRTDIYSNPPR